MSLFGNILEKLGLKHPDAPPAPANPAATAPSPAPQVSPTAPPGPDFSHFTRPEPQSPPPAPSAPLPVADLPPAAPQVSVPLQQDLKPGGLFANMESPQAVAVPQPAPVVQAPAPMPMVDVVSKLNRMAAANPQQLDWKVSIVDLLKLLGLDSSWNALKALATELGCPPELMNDSAQMNTWLHKTVLQKLAENGGNIPKEMLG
ncbi:MAG TPA: DUF3597 domain-containing protein [Anaerolineaceae bacterium]|jgi:hypothetical protein